MGGLHDLRRKLVRLIRVNGVTGHVPRHAPNSCDMRIRLDYCPHKRFAAPLVLIGDEVQPVRHDRDTIGLEPEEWSLELAVVIEPVDLLEASVRALWPTGDALILPEPCH